VSDQNPSKTNCSPARRSVAALFSNGEISPKREIKELSELGGFHSPKVKEKNK
jgi:hypothetical protein